MTMSDRIVALLVAIVSVLIVLGFEKVMSLGAVSPSSEIIDSRGEPFP